jgi:hypothetical protein
VEHSTIRKLNAARILGGHNKEVWKLSMLQINRIEGNVASVDNIVCIGDERKLKASIL